MTDTELLDSLVRRVYALGRPQPDTALFVTPETERRLRHIGYKDSSGQVSHFSGRPDGARVTFRGIPVRIA